MLMSSMSLPPPPPLPPPHRCTHNFSYSLLSSLLQLNITSKFYSNPVLPPVSEKPKRKVLGLRLILLLLHMCFTYLTILCFTNLLNFKLQVCSCKFLLLLLERTKYMFLHHEMIHICGVALDQKWWTIFILECREKKLLKNEFPLDLKTCPLGNLT